MAPQRHGCEVGQDENARQHPRGAHTYPEGNRQGEEWSERLGNLVEPRELRAGLQVQAPLDEAGGSISGQRQSGKGNSERNGVAEKRAGQDASQHGREEAPPGLVVAEEAPPVRQLHPGIDRRAETVPEEVSRSPWRRVRGTQEYESLEPIW